MNKNKVWNSIRKHGQTIGATCLILSMAAGWWGFLYPQLALNADTYRIVTEDGEEVVCEDGTAVYLEMLNADRSKIRFRSKVVEEILKCLERVGRQ